MPLVVCQKGTLVVQADESVPYDAGRNIGRLRVDFDRMGTLQAQEWVAINLNPSVRDDPEMAAWASEVSGG